jgi:YesN/AraC family two-component response regulator
MAGKNYMPPLSKSDKINIPFSGQFIKNTLENLLISIIRKQSNKNNEQPNFNAASFHKNNIVQSAVMYINENVDKRLTLKDISKSVGYSVSYISAVFKKHLGTSLINYFLKVRITKAKQLIEENKYSFNEIAELLGFDSVQYFSTQFKKIAKLTPSQYATMLKVSKYNFDDVNSYLLK